MVHTGSGEGIQAAGNVLCERDAEWRTRYRAIQQGKPEHHRRLIQKSGPGYTRSAQVRKDHTRGEEKIPLASVAQVVEVYSQLQGMRPPGVAEAVRQLQARFAIVVHIRGTLSGDE